MSGPLPGAVPSPDIWTSPDVYEQEDLGVDPEGALEAAVRERLGELGHDGWRGLTVLDVGCGTGFHLPRSATGPGAAGRVVGVEPHPDLLARAAERVRGPPGVEVLAGTAQALPLPDASVDVVHARWAYFFGPGCEPGLAELDRVLRPGGAASVVDDDATRSTFGGWFRRAAPSHDPAAVERFWARRGWSRAGPWTSGGPCRTGRPSRPSSASSSPRRWPTPCWPSTPGPASTTRSTCTPAPPERGAGTVRAPPERRPLSRSRGPGRR